MEPKSVGRFGGNAMRQHAELSGLMAGAIILTLDGEMPVEFLSPGDRVVTRDTGMARIRAIHRRTVIGDAVGIMGGSLGHTRPERDVMIPADQPMLIRDWRAQALAGARQAMIPAGRLVDGEFVTLHHNVEMTVYDIEFDRDHVIYADGLELASAPATEIVAAA
jgi:hypothetical protein